VNFRQLELFIAITETGSFSRGAEAVLLTQSTVSQHMAALENELGTELFDRLGRGVVLTAGGKKFLVHARRILAERDVLRQSMASFQGLENTLLKIGASNVPANYLIPPVLPALKQKHPGITLTMLTGDSREMIACLEKSEIELAVVGSYLSTKKIEFTPLIADSLTLIVGPNHRWAKRDSLSLAELISEPCVVREEGSGSGQALHDALSHRGLNPEELTIGARLGSNEAVLQAIAEGFGCAFVSELSVNHNLGAGEICKVKVDGLTVDRQIWLATLKSRSQSPAAKAFKEVLMKFYD
jgi:DNA-binding transcriptional LysR family regulator